MLRKPLAIFLLFLATLVVLACGNEPAAQKERQDVVFADAGWDSVKFHNAVAGFIGTHAYNINPKVISGSTPIIQTALLRGDVDVHMELWTDNVPSFEADMQTGKLVNLGINFDDDKQGLYVPRYLIEGDASRNIKALAPDLKTVKDLARYSHIFHNPEDPSRGRLYGAIPGWNIDDILYRKYQAYGLDKNYVYFRSGSEAALASAFLAAYTKGEPIVGYCYEPTWISGKLDLVLLADEPYNEAGFARGLTEARSVPVCIVANKQLQDKAPDFAAFLQKYHTSSALTAEALAYIADKKCTYDEAAIWFMQRHPELLANWLPPDKLQQVNKALQGDKAGAASWLLTFPEQVQVDWTKPIDNFVNYINTTYADFFNAVKDILTWCILFIERVLNFIPWWLTIIGIAALTKLLTGKLSRGIIYGAGLFAIGAFGYWSMMNETLAVVISAVIISLLIGLPVGVLVSTSRLANRLLRPFLDAMQTMPTFVYMIPAVMLLGPGKVPAVLATVVYAVVPVIRLTSHGIQQVDQSVVEASAAFGASRWQTLFKVQIPQAMPTIMTGINQTMMMAVAMVVTCAMIGANGLGMEVLIAINRTESGRGLIAGISIVIIAIIIDRLTQSLAKRGKEGR